MNQQWKKSSQIIEIVPPNTLKINLFARNQFHMIFVQLASHTNGFVAEFLTTQGQKVIISVQLWGSIHILTVYSPYSFSKLTKQMLITKCHFHVEVWFEHVALIWIQPACLYQSVTSTFRVATNFILRSLCISWQGRGQDRQFITDIFNANIKTISTAKAIIIWSSVKFVNFAAAWKFKAWAPSTCFLLGWSLETD